MHGFLIEQIIMIYQYNVDKSIEEKNTYWSRLRGISEERLLTTDLVPFSVDSDTGGLWLHGGGTVEFFITRPPVAVSVPHMFLADQCCIYYKGE